MFGYLSMLSDYGQRIVDRYENGDLIVSTTAVNDSEHPYETAVAHPNYNEGRFVVVEEYGSKDAARSGHEQWVKKMTAPELPLVLKDVSTATIGKMLTLGKNTILASRSRNIN